MNENLLIGEKVRLAPVTNRLWHEFYQNYVNDPMMDATPYIYDAEKSERAYQVKTADPTRLYFAVLLKERVVGNIYLKHMSRTTAQAELGVALVNDSVKGQGYGTEAVRLLVRYALDVLDFQTIVADSVLRNTRSQHVLEKVGFRYTHEDEIFKHYSIQKE